MKKILNNLGTRRLKRKIIKQYCLEQNIQNNKKYIHNIIWCVTWL